MHRAFVATYGCECGPLSQTIKKINILNLNVTKKQILKTPWIQKKKCNNILQDVNMEKKLALKIASCLRS